MKEQKSVFDKIEDLVSNHWESGFKCGAEWQKEADREELEEAVREAYEKGHDEGYDEGYVVRSQLMTEATKNDTRR